MRLPKRALVKIDMEQTKQMVNLFMEAGLTYFDADWEDPKVASRANYEVARKHGKSIIVMEPVKGGALANPPKDVRKVFQEVAPVGLGCMGLSYAYGTAVEKSEAVNILRQAFDMGYNFFDTAECYTGLNADGTTSYNEEIVGEAIKPFRDKVFLATKCGVRHSDRGLLLDLLNTLASEKNATPG